jgi:hypothetical protein
LPAPASGGSLTACVATSHAAPARSDECATVSAAARSPRHSAPNSSRRASGPESRPPALAWVSFTPQLTTQVVFVTGRGRGDPSPSGTRPARGTRSATHRRATAKPECNDRSEHRLTQ